jgi:hypothetical protein
MATTDPSKPSMQMAFIYCVNEAKVKIEDATELAEELEAVVASSTEDDPRFNNEVILLRERIDDLLVGAIHLLAG